MIDIPFHIPNIPENIKDIFSKSVQSGWLTTGSQVHKLEEKLTNYLDVKYVVAVNSCTAGLHLSLAAKGFGIGDRFIIPTLTFASTIIILLNHQLVRHLFDCVCVFFFSFSIFEGSTNCDS